MLRTALIAGAVWTLISGGVALGSLHVENPGYLVATKELWLYLAALSFPTGFAVNFLLQQLGWPAAWPPNNPWTAFVIWLPFFVGGLVQWTVLAVLMAGLVRAIWPAKR